MGVIQLAHELQRVIDRRVAQGCAATPTAFLEEAVMRLVEDASAEDDSIVQFSEAGVADIEARRYVTVATEEDRERLHERLIAAVRAAGLAAEGWLPHTSGSKAED